MNVNEAKGGSKLHVSGMAVGPCQPSPSSRRYGPILGSASLEAPRLSTLIDSLPGSDFLKRRRESLLSLVGALQKRFNPLQHGFSSHEQSLDLNTLAVGRQAPIPGSWIPDWSGVEPLI